MQTTEALTTYEVSGEVLIVRNSLSPDLRRALAEGSAAADPKLWRVLQTAASPERSLRALGVPQDPRLADFGLAIRDIVSRDVRYYARHVNPHAALVNRDTNYTLARGGPGCYCTEQVVGSRLLVVLAIVQAPKKGGLLDLPRKKLTFLPTAGSMFIFPAGIDWPWSIETIGEGTLLMLSTYMYAASE